MEPLRENIQAGKYNFGVLSRLVGLGTLIYGVTTQSLETVAGGAALIYSGSTMIAECDALDRDIIQARRNEIIAGLEELLGKHIKKD